MIFGECEYKELTDLHKSINNFFENNDSSLIFNDSEFIKLVTLLNSKCEEFKDYEISGKYKDSFFGIYGENLINYSDILLEPYRNQSFLLKEDIKDNINLVQNIINLKTKSISLLNFVINFNKNNVEYINLIKNEFNKLGALCYSINLLDDAIQYFKNGINLGNKDSFLNLIKLYINGEINSNLLFDSYNIFLKLENNEENLINKTLIMHLLFNQFLSSKEYENAHEILIEYEKRLISELSVEAITTNNFDKLNVYQHILNECYDKLKEIKITLIANDEVLLTCFTANTISKMTPEIKTLIFTSIQIEKYIKQQNQTTLYNYDYSASTISILKALEIVLFEIFKDYLIYLKSIKNINLYYINSCFKYKNNANEYVLKDNVNNFTLANAIFLMSNPSLQNDKIIPNKYFIEYLNEKKFKDINKFIENFCKDLKELINLRNKVAHKSCIDSNDANVVFDLLLNTKKLIELLYDKFSFIFKGETNE